MFCDVRCERIFVLNPYRKSCLDFARTSLFTKNAERHDFKPVGEETKLQPEVAEGNGGNNGKTQYNEDKISVVLVDSSDSAPDRVDQIDLNGNHSGT